MIKYTIAFFFFIFMQHVCDARQSHDTSIAKTGAHEKIYLHTDKAFYMPGEILWFKVYVVDAVSLKPMEISHVAYVEVLNEKAEPVLQAKIELGSDKTNNGSLYIPNQLATGKYHIVAYTNLMKNQGAEHFFSAVIDIVNPFDTKEGTASSTEAGTYSLDLFPESGDLLDGIPTRIGYKFVDNNGRGRTFSADIIEEDSIRSGRVVSNKYGMGSFDFTPRKGRRYRLQINDEQAIDINADFPEIKEKGYLFNARHLSSGNWEVSVAASPDNRNLPLSLQAATQFGDTKSFALELNEDAKATIQIRRDELPAGVICLTLFEKQVIPVAERLIFQYPEKAIDIKTTLTNKIMSRRGGLGVKIRPTVDNRFVEADMSLAVFKVDDLQRVPHGNIISYFYLQSHVNGFIDDAGYYFPNGEPSQQVVEDLDHLLLTQGWRRIKSVAETANNLVEYQYHSVQVRYTQKHSNEPFKGENVYLALPGRQESLFVAKTNDQGVATFTIRNSYGIQQLVTRLVSGQESNVELISPFYSFDNRFLAVYTNSHVNDHEEILLKKMVDIQAENAYNKENRAKFIIPVTDTTIPFYGDVDATYRLDDYTRFVVMEEVLREYISEVSVRRSRSNYGLRVLDPYYREYFSVDPLILLDGVPLSSANEIIDYDPLKVERIDIVTTECYLGDNVFNGIVNFRTYDGQLKDFELNTSNTILNYVGLQYQREFYAPVYDDEMRQNHRLPDYRDVLLWQPDIVLDENGEANLSIVMSDLPGRYALVIQGIDENGIMGSFVDYFDVN